MSKRERDTAYLRCYRVSACRAHLFCLLSSLGSVAVSESFQIKFSDAIFN